MGPLTDSLVFNNKSHSHWMKKNRDRRRKKAIHMDDIKNKIFVNIKRSGTITSTLMDFPELLTSHKTVIVLLMNDIDKIY